MGSTLTKGTLFPAQLTNEMINKVRGKSSLAKLSGAAPMAFNGQDLFTFNLDNEVNIVGENGAKANGGATIAKVSMRPVKIEYGVRISDEFKYAAEEIKLQYLQAFAEGFARKVARGIDLMAMHGINPRTGEASDEIGTNCFDSKVTQIVAFDSSTPDANVEAAIALVEGNEHDVTGMAMAPALRNALAALKTQANANTPLYPELAWGSNPGTIHGLPVDTNSTVSANGNDDRGIVGNFADYFRWGYARQIPLEVIEYGNPDNSDAGDLKGHNQVYLRGEAYIGWGIILPEAFARIKNMVSG